MTEKYLVYGNEPSPYSIKVRSYFRYKRIPHSWIERSYKTNSEFKKHAKIAIVPLVITSEKKAIQDSTPIIQSMERRVADRDRTCGDRLRPQRRHDGSQFLHRVQEWTVGSG